MTGVPGWVIGVLAVAVGRRPFRWPPQPTAGRQAATECVDLALTLRRLVDALGSWLDTSSLISHLLWREADTHDAVREAVAAVPPSCSRSR